MKAKLVVVLTGTFYNKFHVSYHAIIFNQTHVVLNSYAAEGRNYYDILGAHCFCNQQYKKTIIKICKRENKNTDLALVVV